MPDLRKTLEHGTPDRAPFAAAIRDGLGQEPNAWAAPVAAISKILGWSDGARAHAAHTIRVALMATRSG
jgi:hypothetical protein